MTIYVFSFIYSYINHCLDYHNVWNEQESVWIVHRSISAANVDQQTLDLQETFATHHQYPSYFHSMAGVELDTASPSGLGVCLSKTSH